MFIKVNFVCRGINFCPLTPNTIHNVASTGKVSSVLEEKVKLVNRMITSLHEILTLPII